MALQFEEITEDGVVHPEAYAKLHSLRCSWHPEGYLYLVVQVFHDKTTRDESKAPVNVAEKGLLLSSEDYNAYFSEELLAQEGMTIRKASYLYMKTLPVFKNAKDV